MGTKKVKGCLVVLVAVLITVSLVVTAYGQPAPKAKTLKGVSFLPTFVSVVHFTGVFAERVTKRSNGELILQWTGGPEIIDGFAQDDALASGTIDFAGLTPSWYVDKIPANRSFMLSQLTNKEERQSGYYDFMNQLHMKQGIVNLGHIATMPFFFLLTKPISRPQEFKGLKIGSSAAFNDFLMSMGAVPVEAPEEYAAMQRKVIDGAGSGALDSAVSRSWHEVCKWVPDHGFYKVDVLLLMSLKTWNGLSRKQQDLIKQVALEIEQEQETYFVEREASARKKMTDAGVQFIKFSPEDAAWYLDKAYSSRWAELQKRLDAETYTKIRQLLKAK